MKNKQLLTLATGLWLPLWFMSLLIVSARSVPGECCVPLYVVSRSPYPSDTTSSKTSFVCLYLTPQSLHSNYLALSQVCACLA